MDKEHRFGALANLFYLLSLGKRPAVAMLAKSRSGIHQREGRQAKLVFELSGKLIPYAGIAAVLHKALHVIGSFLSRYCHRGCRTHRNTVNHLTGILRSSVFTLRSLSFTLHSKNLIGDFRPSDYIPSILPSHLDMVALTLSMSIQIWQEHIIPHIVIIEIGDVQHSLGAHLIAMHHHGSLFRSFRCIEIDGMGLVARRHHDKGILHAMVLIHRVHPANHPGALVLHSVLPMLSRHSLLLRIVERIIEHIVAGTIQSQHHEHH